MSDLDNNRAQRDAQRSAASRRSNSSAAAEHALIRHLGVELYKEHHQGGHASDAPGRTDADRTDESDADCPTDRSSDR